MQSRAIGSSSLSESENLGSNPSTATSEFIVLIYSCYNKDMSIRNTKEHNRRASAKYRAKNREKINQKQREMKVGLKLDALQHYGLECKRCGFGDVRALQIDHTKNDGNIERGLLGGKNFSGWRFYSWLKKNDWPDGYQTLCANCNVIKHIENKLS